MTRRIADFRRIICLVLVAGSLLLPSLVSAAPPLRVAISPDYEPLAFKKDGEIAGIEVDNAQAVANVLGRRLKLIEMPFDEFIPSLDIGKVDVVMSGYSVTAERAEKVDYTRPFMEVGQMVIVRTDDVVRFSHPSALRASGVHTNATAAALRDSSGSVGATRAAADWRICAVGVMR